MIPRIYVAAGDAEDNGADHVRRLGARVHPENIRSSSTVTPVKGQLPPSKTAAYFLRRCLESRTTEFDRNREMPSRRFHGHTFGACFAY